MTRALQNCAPYSAAGLKFKNSHCVLLRASHLLRSAQAQSGGPSAVEFAVSSAMQKGIAKEVGNG